MSNSKLQTVRLLRSLLRELREAKNGSPRNTMAYGYLIDQFRKNQVTSEKYCKERNEMLNQAQTYLSLLRSTREHEALQALYRRGERSVEDSAKLVGLQLPKRYDE